MSTDPSRRRFCGALAAITTLACGPARAAWGIFAPDDARRLCALLRDRESAARVGALYLRSAGAEHGPALLVQRIAERLQHAGVALHDAGAPALRAGLQCAVQQDFHDARVVSVGGWMLSETEARLCALVALSA